MPIRIEAGTGQHIGDRTEQQDRLLIIPSKKEPGVVLAVVADGMGGPTGGAMAAQQVVSTAQQIFENYSTKDETPQKLLTSIVHESHLIITLSSYTSEQEPHSTVVAMLLQKDRADWAHVGDIAVPGGRRALWRAGLRRPRPRPRQDRPPARAGPDTRACAGRRRGRRRERTRLATGGCRRHRPPRRAAPSATEGPPPTVPRSRR